MCCDPLTFLPAPTGMVRWGNEAWLFYLPHPDLSHWSRAHKTASLCFRPPLPMLPCSNPHFIFHFMFLYILANNRKMMQHIKQTILRKETKTQTAKFMFLWSFQSCFQDFCCLMSNIFFSWPVSCKLVLVELNTKLKDNPVILVYMLLFLTTQQYACYSMCHIYCFCLIHDIHQLFWCHLSHSVLTCCHSTGLAPSNCWCLTCNRHGLVGNCFQSFLFTHTQCR